MSILIKGMEMPNNCWECPLMSNLSCSYNNEIISNTQRREDCPIIEVPPHGDLIDRDVLRASFKESIDECHKWMNELNIETSMYVAARQAHGTFIECSLRAKGMPTVIPADEDGET